MQYLSFATFLTKARYARGLLLIPLSLFGEMTESQLTRRVYDHMLVKDTLSALSEGRRALECYPDSATLNMAYFRALCQQGDELEALKFWEKISPEQREERSVLESLAWGVLNKAKQSSQLEIRLNVLKAAASTRDVRALPLILEEMRSSNATLRSTAIRLAANFGDAPLKKELERLFAQEKLWYVRLEIIQAMGQLKMMHMQSCLKEMLFNSKATLEEKGIVQVALVSMYEQISREELLQLVKSDRAALRHLACQIISYLELVELAPEIFPLLQDTSSDVRMAAITTLTLLKVDDGFELIKPLLDDTAFDVAITAAWSAMCFNPKCGEEKLAYWIKDPNAEHRQMAAGALAVAGPQGVPLAAKMMKESSDLYVQATLAVGLIHQRKRVHLAQKVLYNLLMADSKSEWMWDAHLNPLFRSLAPSRVRHREGVAQYPKVVDQMVHLELLSLLCITEHPKAEEAVRGFLKSQSWGVTGAATSILLGEGNELSIEISHKLLEDGDEKVRLQAAFILSMMGHSEEALPLLIEAYPTLDRALKLQVLEVIAAVGEEETLPFLVEQLKEPFQTLRVAAASALIRCLYH